MTPSLPTCSWLGSEEIVAQLVQPVQPWGDASSALDPAQVREYSTQSTKTADIQQYHRISEWSGLEGTSGGHPAQPPAEAGSPRAGCTGPCPSGS